MQVTFKLFISFTFCFAMIPLSGLTFIQAQSNENTAQALRELVGVYEGSYRAGQGDVGLTLTVYEEGGNYKAIFDFYNLPGKSNSATGKYRMNVSYNTSTKKYLLKGYEWIVRPGNYSFADLEGTLAGEVFSGSTYNFRVVIVDPAEVARRKVAQEAEIAKRDAEQKAEVAKRDAEQKAEIARREEERKAGIAKREKEIGEAVSNAMAVQGNNLADKLAWLQAFAQSNSNYVVEINNDENITSPLLLEYTGKSSIIIIFRGIGANRSLNGRVTVSSGITLVLDRNLTLKGGVIVNSGGELVMNNGSTVTGSENSGISINGGIFTMNGGTISGNSRDATGYAGGTRDTFPGGGVSIAGGTFHMRGGTISGNSGGGVGINGSRSTMGFGGASVGTFHLDGGTISGNNGGGVHVNSSINLGAELRGTFNMNGGTISNNNGNGVIVRRDGSAGSAIFTMNSGTISNNRGSGVSGGGSFTMNEGIISGNTATNGGGVSGVTFTMNGGTISGNTATENGGGVSTGTFNMKGGVITGNIANQNGGGVFVGNGNFTKTGGSIIGYSSDQGKGNLVKDGSNAVLNFRGHAVYAGSTSRIIKIKEKSAESGDNLSYNGSTNPATSSGTWDN